MIRLCTVEYSNFRATHLSMAGTSHVHCMNHNYAAKSASHMQYACSSSTTNMCIALHEIDILHCAIKYSA